MTITAEDRSAFESRARGAATTMRERSTLAGEAAMTAEDRPAAKGKSKERGTEVTGNRPAFACGAAMTTGDWPAGKSKGWEAEMTTMTEDGLAFENEEWRVTDGGLEHKGTGYFIERESVGQRRSDGLWSWPLHMAEKQWCTLAPFTEAFTCATALYDLKADTDLAHSFKAARCDVAAWPKTVPVPAHEGIAGLAESLNSGGRAPISIEAPELRDFWAQDSRGDGPQHPYRANQVHRERARGRARSGSVAALPWRTPRPIRRAGTRLVEFLQAALSRK